MNKLKNTSKLLHVLIILSFFLPFYPKGCDDGVAAKEQARLDSLKKDSIIRDSLRIIQKLTEQEVQKRIDSIIKADSLRNKVQQEIHDSIAAVAPKNSKADTIETSRDTIRKSTPKENIEFYQYASKLAEKSSFFRLIFKPDGNYSGMGYVVDVLLPFILYGGPVISFILLLIGLFLKFRKKKAFFWLTFGFSIISLGCLYVSVGSFFFGRLWGFWVCFILIGIQALLDLMIAIKLKISKE